jgi:carboxypeptidase Q
MIRLLCIVACAVLVSVSVSCGGSGANRNPAAPPARTAAWPPIAAPSRSEVARIIEAALADDGAWQKLAYLTDRIGPRLSGSASLERAVAWALDTLRADGHENVAAEKVMVPHWERGHEAAVLLTPDRRDLVILGLGGTVATPGSTGLTADVVVVDDFDQLAGLGTAVKGKIVLFNSKMPPFSFEKGASYGEVVRYRGRGPVEAARLGAAAVLVRSLTAKSLRSAHTGATNYEDGVRRIPAAALTIEDADLIARLAAAGEPVRVWLQLGSRTGPDKPSANVVAELRGRERPDEIVLLGAHLDSWDVGQGAHDNGAGCAIMMQALTVLRRLGLQPRRTLRVVLFTNEENGLRGATEYARAHGDDIERHMAAFESDSGAFKPLGFEYQGGPAGLVQAHELAKLLTPLDAARVRPGFAGADLIPLVQAGVPSFGLWVDESTYFDIHHTHADTLDKVDPEHLRQNVAVMAVMAHAIADAPEALGAADRQGRAAAPQPGD